MDLNLELNLLQKRMIDAIKRKDLNASRRYYEEIKKFHPSDSQDNEHFVLGLQHAVESGDINIVKYFVEHKEEMSCTYALFRTNSKGEVPIKVAGMKGFPLIEHLLHQKQFISLNFCNKYRRTPLCHSIYCNSIEAVKHCLQSGAIEHIDELAIVAAVEMNNFPILRLLTVREPAICDAEAAIDQRNIASITAIKLKRPIGIISYLFSTGAVANYKDKQGIPALQWAVKTDYVDAVQYLLNKGADVFATDPDGNIAMSLAKEPQIKQLLLTAMLDQCSFKNLFSVIQCGDVEAVRSFLQSDKGKQDINATDEDGNTPLNVSIQYNYIDLVKYLVSIGADVCKVGVDGQTPLMKAAAKGNVEVCKILLDNGASLIVNTALVTAIQKNRLEIVRLFVEYGADLKRTGKNGNTPLIEAIQCKSIKIVKYLLEAVKDTNECEKALNKSIEMDDLEVIKFIVESRKVDVNTVLSDGSLLLHRFIDKNNLDMVKLLIQKGANVDKEDEDGYSPLHLALKKSREEIIKLLLSHGVNVKAFHPELFPDYIESNSTDIIKGLITNGMDPNVKVKGRTLLHRNLIDNNVEMIEFLLENKADVNVKDENGNSLLHLCLDLARLDLFKMFVNHGGDVFVKNDKGKSLLAIAAAKRLFILVDLLMKRGAKIEEAKEELVAFAQENEDFAYYMESYNIDKKNLITGDGHEPAEDA